MKALDKDRSRRYETANGFALDIERFLNDEPVSAGPPSAAYRFRKFARRNSGKLVAVSIVVILLLSCVIVSTWFALRATRSEAVAIQNANEVQRQSKIVTAVQQFFINDVIGQTTSTPTYVDPDLSLRDAVTRASRDISAGFADEPIVEAAVRSAIAPVFASFRDFENALDQAIRSQELQQIHLGALHPDTLKSQALVGRYLGHTGQYDQAISILQSNLENCHNSLPMAHDATIATVRALASVHGNALNFERGAEFTKEATDLLVERFGKDAPRTIQSLKDLAENNYRLSRLDDAAKLFREVLTRANHVLGENSGVSLFAIRRLADIDAKLRRFEQAEAGYQKAIRLARDHWGEDHYTTTYTEIGYALLLQSRSRFDEAATVLVSLTNRLEQPGNHDQRSLAQAYAFLAVNGRETGDCQQWEEFSRKAFEVQVRLDGIDHSNTAMGFINTAQAMLIQGNSDETIEFLSGVIPQLDLAIQRVGISADAGTPMPNVVALAVCHVIAHVDCKNVHYLVPLVWGLKIVTRHKRDHG